MGCGFNKSTMWTFFALWGVIGLIVVWCATKLMPGDENDD
jgi:hypothetical protein